MLAVLSPAKSLDLTEAPFEVDGHEPVLMKDAESLMKTARGLSQKEIRRLMSVSAELAKLNYDRYRSFELPFDNKNARHAAFAFNGGVYQGLDARTLSKAELEWAEGHVAILSGMFGLLRPLDWIQPYRLEMGTRLKTRRGRNLYAFWGDRITVRINAILEEHEDRSLINLASNEYFKSVWPRNLVGTIVTCVFEDWKDDVCTSNVISFMAKHARGLMARYLIEHRVDRTEGLKDFDSQRYAFQPDRSDETKLVFGRKFVPMAERVD